jgi:hypothetical protein
MPRNQVSKKNVSLQRPEKKSRPRKTFISEPAPDSEAKKALDAIENNRKQILEMQNRILAAPAMNGGFSTLMYKIEKIEQSQGQIVEKVDEIRDVLYDPDSGLYARIKNVENETIDAERFTELEEEVKTIKNWKSTEEKLAEKEEQHELDVEKILKDHAEVIKELQSWYQKQAAVTKWLALTVGTSLLGLCGKLLHSFVMNHIQII